MSEMRRWIRSSFSYLGHSALVSVVLLPLSIGAASDAPHLSSAQAAIIAKQTAKLKYPQERGLVSQWSDAKKAAEFICRPLAASVLKRRLRTADRVFLGTENPKTLRLVSNRRLEGSGQVRSGDQWRTFTFYCVLDPQTGKAVSFAANLT
jgi:hypothetical protein